MTMLETRSNMPDPDEFYAVLIAAHEGLSKDQSDALNARLVLTLANHIGDMRVIEGALDLAKSVG